MRTIKIMVEHHDPCECCKFQELCSDYGGCMGWTPDDAEKTEIVRLKERVKELDVLYEFGCRQVAQPPCAAEGLPWQIGLSGAGGKCTVFGATLEEATKSAVAELDQWAALDPCNDDDHDKIEEGWDAVAGAKGPFKPHPQLPEEGCVHRTKDAKCQIGFCGKCDGTGTGCTEYCPVNRTDTTSQGDSA